MLVLRVLVAVPRAARLRGAPQRLFTRRFSPLAWYNKQLEKAPVITKCITSGGRWLHILYTWKCITEPQYEGNTNYLYLHKLSTPWGGGGYSAAVVESWQHNSAVKPARWACSRLNLILFQDLHTTSFLPALQQSYYKIISVDSCEPRDYCK